MAASVSIMSPSPPSFRAAQPPSRLVATAALSQNRNFSITAAASRSGLLHSSFLSSPTPVSSSFSSSFSGLSLGIGDFNSGSNGINRRGGGGRFVVRAGKAALCLTKRNRSCKSLARTHGFRRRMKTTAGRAILKRRRAKGRKVLCTKTNSNSGKKRNRA